MKIEYRKFESLRRFGVEFEMSNNLTRKCIAEAIKSNSHRQVRISRYSLSSKNDYWHVKSDSSCGPRGIDGPSGTEVATYICSGPDDLKHISKTMGTVRRKGACVNEHCGLHVHVEVSDFTEEDIGRMLLFWVAIEPILNCAMPYRRKNNKYCKTLTSVHDGVFLEWMYRLHGSESIARIFKPCNDLFMDNAAKRRTVNVVNFYKVLDRDDQPRKTVEFRWPEGTLRPSDVKSWVVMFVSFVDSVKSRLGCPLDFMCKNGGPDVRDALEILGLGTGGAEGGFSILDRDLLHARKWLLRRIIAMPSSISLKDASSRTCITNFQSAAKIQAQTLLDLMCEKH